MRKSSICVIQAATMSYDENKTSTPRSLYPLLAWVPLLRSSQRVVQVIMVAVDSNTWPWTLVLKGCHLIKAAGPDGHLVAWTLWVLMHISECMQSYMAL